MVTCDPGGYDPIAMARPVGPFIFLPSTCVITSPRFIPAAAAGSPLTTSETSAPLYFLN